MIGHLSSESRRITSADIKSISQKYIDLDHLQVVAVGDAAEARDVLAKYGKVEAYDADGKPVASGEVKNK